MASYGCYRSAFRALTKGLIAESDIGRNGLTRTRNWPHRLFFEAKCVNLRKVRRPCPVRAQLRQEVMCECKHHSLRSGWIRRSFAQCGAGRTSGHHPCNPIYRAHHSDRGSCRNRRSRADSRGRISHETSLFVPVAEARRLSLGTAPAGKALHLGWYWPVRV